MAHTHEFDCRVCGAHLDSNKELEDHNRKNHPEQLRANPTGGSSGSKSGSAPPNTSNR
jgi:hypothetical protein